MEHPAPSYLMNMCQPVVRNLHCCHLHSAVHSDWITGTVCYGPRSFAVAGQSMWNLLPALLRNHELSAMSFCCQLRLNYTLEDIILFSTLLSVFDVRVGEHNFNVMKKAPRETQTLHAGCSKMDPKFFALLQTPLPGGRRTAKI